MQFLLANWFPVLLVGLLMVILTILAWPYLSRKKQESSSKKAAPPVQRRIITQPPAHLRQVTGVPIAAGTNERLAALYLEREGWRVKMDVGGVVKTYRGGQQQPFKLLASACVKVNQGGYVYQTIDDVRVLVGGYGQWWLVVIRPSRTATVFAAPNLSDDDVARIESGNHSVVELLDFTEGK